MGGFQSFPVGGLYPGFMKAIIAWDGATLAGGLDRPDDAAGTAGERSQLERRLVLQNSGIARTSRKHASRDADELWPGADPGGAMPDARARGAAIRR